MKKLTLDVETLAVESFEAERPAEARGTVLGADSAPTLPGYCITFTCGDSRIRPCLEA
ncbi:MAG TPA: hypothetical protein VHG91_10555 [Longimicrobium sp.]|nr:hypothetical protein [Longimicrobium sp.]